MKKLFPLMLVMLAIIMPMKLWAQEPYAVLTTDSATILSQDSTGVTYGKTLTFYYDDQKTAKNGLSVGPFYESSVSWYNQRENITSVVFDDSFANCATLTSTAYWFSGCSKITFITGILNLKTDNVTNMSCMFEGCSGLTSLDVSNFNTENVTYLDGMFYDCSGLTSLDVSHFNTANVTDMGYMFSLCSGLTTLDVSSFKTDNVTNMSYMFEGCSGLTTLDVSHFNTANVTDMSLMFSGCSGLTSLDLSNFKTDNVTEMFGMFYGCSSLTTLDVSHFNTANVTDMEWMFHGCSGLTTLDVSNFNTDNVTNMGGMFYGCSHLTTLDISNFNTSNVTDMAEMFGGCSGLTTLDVSGFNTDNVTYMRSMFESCYGLTSLDLSHFNTANVTYMRSMFYGCSSLTSLDLSHFNTANVTEMKSMFSGCSELNTIYAGRGWSTEAVTEGGNMFTGCTKLVGGAGTPYDSNHVDYTYAHIDGGSSNPGYFTDIESVRRWDFTKWSSETIANLKADAAASKTTGWSDVEKKADAEAGAEPTEAAKDNCFWLDAETTEANGVAIAELEGLVFNKSYCSSRKLAIAVNYPSTSLGDYAGGAYLWLGGMDSDCFTIPNVKNGQTITIELESHKTSDGRGITLIAGSTELDSFTTMTKASYSWTIPEDCDVVVRNTNGCHIYTITVSGEGTPTDTLEIYAVETGSTITPNQPIMATQSVVVTPGNDVEWLTNMSMGSAWVNPLDFTSNIYYPGSTTTYTFEGSMRGTNNPKDGDIEDGVSTGNGYKPYQKNYPKSGGFLTFEVQQEGSLIIPIRVFAGKPLYVTDKTGTAKKDIQFKDASGQTLALQTNPLCAVSADEDVTGFVSFNVQPGEKYYVFSVGSKARFGGYVFSKQAIDIDPTTMANVIDSLDALPTTLEPYAVLTTDTTSVLSSDSTGVTYGKTLTFYYDNQKEARNGISVGAFSRDSDVPWYDQRVEITKVIFNDSFANCNSLTSTVYWFYQCSKLGQIEGIENLKTDSVTNMSNMFRDCSSLTNLDVSNFNTANVTNMGSMFRGCSSLTTLDVSNFNTANVTYMSDMFNGCSGLRNLDVSNFNTENVTDISGMFSGCSGLTSLDVSSFNTANVTDMSYMFYDCFGLTSLDLSNFNTANVTNMERMFRGCSDLTSLDVSNFKTDNVTNMSSMFYGCSSLTNLDVSGFKTDNVTGMSFMFGNCSSLTTIYAGSGWSTEAVANGGNMFTDCVNLVGGAGTAYDSNHIDHTYAHIDGGTSNPGYFTDKNQETDNKFSTCAEVGAGEDGKTYRVRGRVKSISNTTFGNWYIEDATDSLYIYGTVDYVGRYPRDGMSWESYGINVGDTVTVQGPKSTYKGVPELVDVRVLSPITLLNVSSNDTAMIAMINRESIRLASNAATVTAKLYYAGSNCEVTIPDHAQSWLTLQSIEANNGDAEAIFSISDNITTGKRGAEVLFKTSNDSIVYETALFISQNDLELSPYAVLTTDSTVVLSSDSIAQNTLRKTWDFRNGFSAKTVNALKTDLEEFGDSKYWRNYESDAAKSDEQHFWNASKDAKNSDGFACTHNGGQEKVIPELDGLVLGMSNAKKFVITYDGATFPNEFESEGGPAIGEPIPHGNSYIWLNGKNETIKFKAEVNQTIKIAVESHAVNKSKLGEARGISLSASGGSLELVSGNPVPTYYTECEWNLTGDAGAVAELTLKSTNGCHIYYIIVGDGDDPNANKTTGITYGQTLTFYYDDKKTERNGMSVGPFTETYDSGQERWNIDSGWDEKRENITTVVFDDSFANCTTLTSTAYWFYECNKLKAISGIEYLKTDNVTDMGYMFFGCSGLTNLDVSNFKTDNVTDMRSMFYGCSGLTNLDVSNFKTDNVTDMSWMFYCCSGLTNLDVSNFKTDNVTDMSRMFYGCSGLTSLDVSNFKTDIVTDISRMFSDCSGLTSLDVSNFNTDKVNSMWSMFSDCSGLTNLDVSNFKTDNVTDISGMFFGCSGLTSLDVSNFKTDNVTDMSGMFSSCSGLTSLDVSNFKTDNVTDMRSMFYGCSGLTNLDVSNFNTSNVTDIRGMFSGCSSLTTIYIGNGWSTEAVTNGRDMFYNCTKLIGGRGTTYDENHTDYTYAHIDGGPSNPGYFTDKNAPVIEATFDGRVLAVGGSTTMTDALESVGGRDEVAKTITAIVWNSSATLTNSDLQGLDNPNLLIYVNERSLAPENRNNVVVNGLAMNVVLSDTGSGNCDFYAPQTFTAEMITYSREFKQATQVGVCRGWETISLPFMVQTITHADNGVIAPFGVDTSNKHFWLRQLSTNGLVSATKIEANLPYLISMPNDEKNYAKEYILKGLVTFSAQNAVVPKTEPTALALADSSIVMMPALQSVGKSSTVWALNVGQERTQYFEGSTFERDYREVRPFEAYTIHRSDTPAPRFLPINDLMNSATGIETISNVIMTHDNYYRLDGRKVDGKPTKKGLYITNGRKVVIK